MEPGHRPHQTIRGWGWTPQNLLSLDPTITITGLLVAPLHPNILDSMDNTGGPRSCQGPPKSPRTRPHHLVAPTHPDILDRTKNTAGGTPQNHQRLGALEPQNLGMGS